VWRVWNLLLPKSLLPKSVTNRQPSIPCDQQTTVNGLWLGLLIEPNRIALSRGRDATRKMNELIWLGIITPKQILHP
jgi:hypothetical protein